MSEVFEEKVRKVGNSLGIIIPHELAEEGGFAVGDTICVTIPNTDAQTRLRKLRALVGIAPGLPPFKREKEDRF